MSMKRSLLSLSLLLVVNLYASDSCKSPAVTVVNRGGVMAQPRVHFVFWGSYWLADGSNQADLIVRSYSRVAPEYFSGLAQYGVGTPRLAGMATVTAYEPPSYVTQVDVALLLGSIKPMQGTYYVVLIPPAQASPFRGFHSYFQDFDGSVIPFAWVTSGASMIPDVFHELIEGMTDPTGKGVQTMTPAKSPLYWSEIADACESACSLSNIGGVSVPSYWSQSDGACIAPGSNQSRINPTLSLRR